MIKSINGWAFAPERSLEESFVLARNFGLQGFEVVIADQERGAQNAVTLDSTQSDCERWRELATQNNLQIVSVASGLGWQFPMTADDEKLRRAGIEANKKALQISAWLGTDALLCVPGGVDADFVPYFPRTSYDKAMQRTHDALREIKPVAETLNVTLAIENVWNKFLLSPLEMRDLVDELSSPRIGVFFDCGNVLQTGYPEDWIRILGPRIARIHLKDFKKSVGTLNGFCPLLEGDVDYKAVMQALREVGYNGPLTAEYFSENDLEPCSKAIDKILEM